MRRSHILAIFAVPMLVESSNHAAPKLCVPSTTVVIPGAQYRPSNNNQQRIELRRCKPGVADALQLVVWQDLADAPEEIIDTAGVEILQLLVAKNIFAAELAGGSRNHVYVIKFTGERSRIVLKQASADRTVMSIRENVLHLAIPNVWTHTTDLHSIPIE